MKEKSILDKVPVESSSFDEVFGKHRKLLMSIVGHCPKCGCPIYGRNVVGDEEPEVKRSCFCSSEVSKKFEETVHAK